MRVEIGKLGKRPAPADRPGDVFQPQGRQLQNVLPAKRRFGDYACDKLEDFSGVVSFFAGFIP